MALSDRNRWSERLLAAKLTGDEYRLAVALERLLLGYRVLERALGERILRETAQLHGRSFTRARARLVGRGLIRYQAGSVGRGNRSTYTLLLDEEKPAEST